VFLLLDTKIVIIKLKTKFKMENLTRKCSICNKELKYSTIYSLRTAEKKNSLCKSCGLKNTMTEERLKKMSERVKGENNPMHGKKGNLNPFFGKSHSDETKKKMIENKDYSNYKTKEFREKMSKVTSGKNNPMFGKTFYEIWVDKYGQNIADEKLKSYKQKQSISSSGENNPMYGKPSPNGSGNGWSGWYNGWFFRSIMELSYMVKVIERFNLKWESGETDKYKIAYTDYKGTNRNYFPDFVINDKYLVEIKPKNLFKSESVSLKKESSIKFCEENGMKYKLRSVSNLNNKEITDLYLTGKIKFTDRYEEKFIKTFLSY
jgi:hypothetical protein